MTRLTFLSPPFGFTETAYELAPVAGADGLFALRAESGDARLYLLDAAAHLPAYRPPVPRIDREELGGPPLRLLLVINPAASPTTVNLAAPILVSSDGRARQCILDRGDWPLRASLAEVLAA
ncbi:flagellar assembly protein FliW [Agromyces soli]